MAITVEELEKKLSQLPRDWKVILEGCDCTGECIGYSSLDDEKTIVLRRDYGEMEWEKVEIR